MLGKRKDGVDLYFNKLNGEKIFKRDSYEPEFKYRNYLS